MDLFDIFSGQESWHTRRLLELAKTLTGEQLDRTLTNQIHVFPWDGPDQSLRQLLDRIVQTKEAWAAALTGGNTPESDKAPAENRTPATMMARLHEADRAFHSVLSDVRPKRLRGHVCRRPMRIPGNVHLRWHVRTRDYL